MYRQSPTFDRHKELESGSHRFEAVSHGFEAGSHRFEKAGSHRFLIRAEEMESLRGDGKPRGDEKPRGDGKPREEEMESLEVMIQERGKK